MSFLSCTICEQSAGTTGGLLVEDPVCNQAKQEAISTASAPRIPSTSYELHAGPTCCLLATSSCWTQEVCEQEIKHGNVWSQRVYIHALLLYRTGRQFGHLVCWNDWASTVGRPGTAQDHVSFLLHAPLTSCPCSSRWASMSAITASLSATCCLNASNSSLRPAARLRSARSCSSHRTRARLCSWACTTKKQQGRYISSTASWPPFQSPLTISPHKARSAGLSLSSPLHDPARAYLQRSPGLQVVQQDLVVLPQ